jgi:hypothetical protein
MKALFVFILFSILFSSSSQGSFLDIYQKKAKEIQEQKEYEQHLFTLYYLTGSEEYSSMAIKLIDFLEEEEMKGNKICISFNPDEDWNGAQNDVAFFTLLTSNHYGWMQNIGNCDTVWHFGHGKMISNETLMVSYDITMEKVASLFPGINHLSSSCRGSYEWIGGFTSAYEEYQKKFNRKETMQKMFSPINSELGVGNLAFTSRMGLWSYSGLFEAFKP